MGKHTNNTPTTDERRARDARCSHDHPGRAGFREGFGPGGFGPGGFGREGGPAFGPGHPREGFEGRRRHGRHLHRLMQRTFERGFEAGFAAAKRLGDAA